MHWTSSIDSALLWTSSEGSHNSSSSESSLTTIHDASGESLSSLGKGSASSTLLSGFSNDLSSRWDLGGSLRLTSGGSHVSFLVSLADHAVFLLGLDKFSLEGSSWWTKHSLRVNLSSIGSEHSAQQTNGHLSKSHWFY